MQVTFYIVALSGLAFFLFAKRRFDFYSLAYFSALVYFLPGFAGFALTPFGTGQHIPSPLIGATYLVMIFVLIAIPVGAMLYDRTSSGCPLPVRISGSGLTGLVATLTGFIGLLMTLLTVGSALFSANKLETLDALNHWYVVWTTGAAVGAVVLFSQRRWIWLPLPFFLLFFDIYIGNRSSFALSVLSVFLIWLYQHGPIRLLAHQWCACLLGAGVALFLFLYKTIYIFVKTGDWDRVFSALTSSKTYLIAIADSEPFIIQGVLNKILDTHFQVGMDHMKYVLYQFVLFAPQAGAEPVGFNSLYQPALFPGYKWGLANNIWAQMWSSGGWLLLFFFIVLFVFLLGVFSALIRIADKAVSGGIVLLGSFFAFYIHRNDLLYQVNLEKRVLLFMMASLVISVIISGALKIRRE